MPSRRNDIAILSRTCVQLDLRQNESPLYTNVPEKEMQTSTIRWSIDEDIEKTPHVQMIEVK